MCLRASRSTQLHQPRLLDEAEHQQLARGVDAAADEPLQQREAAVEARARAREIGRSVWGMIHGAVRWKTCICCDVGRDRGHELDRRGARADHGDALALDVVVVVPLRGVEHRGPGSARGPRCRASWGRSARRRRRPARGRCSVAAVGLDAPALRVLVPGGAGHGRAEPDGAARRRSPRRRAAGRPRSRAAWSRCASSPGWARTRTSTGATGRRSAQPGYVLNHHVPPTCVAALEHDEVLDAGLAQLDRHAQAGEAGADDGDVDLGGSTSASEPRGRSRWSWLLTLP